MDEPFVVVGGDAAGLNAASKCKREDPDRDVIVFEQGAWISYAHRGTPYYVKGEVERLDLAYAPPFSPVWDPVLVAAKVLRGRMEG